MEKDIKDSPKAGGRVSAIRYLKIAGVFFVSFAILLMLLAASAVFLINSDPIKSFARDRINHAIPGTMSWGRLDISLLKGGIRLKNFVLTNEDRQEMIRLGSAEIKLAWPPLLRKELHLTLVEVNSPDILIDAAPAEETSDAGEHPAGVTVLPVNIKIDTLTIKDGSVAYQDKAKQLSIRLENINTEVGQFDLADQSVNLEVSLSGSSVRYKEHESGIDRFEASAVFLAGDLASFGMNLHSTSGAVTARGSGTRIFDRPSLKVSLNGEKLKVPFKEDLPDIDLSADGEFEDGRVLVSLLRINGMGIMVDGKGSFVVDSHQVDARVALQSETVSYIGDFLGTPAGGGVEFTAAISGSLEQPVIDGLLKTRSLKIDRFDVGDAQIQMKLDPPDTASESSLTIETLSIRNNGAELDAAGKIERILTGPGVLNKNPGLALSFSGSRIPIENFLADAAGVLDFSGEINGTIHEPAGSAEAQINQGTYSNQPFERMAVKVEAVKDKITLHEITALISPDAEIRGSGWVSIQNRQYGATFNALEFPLEAVKQIEELNIGSGIADVRLTAQGTFDSPGAEASVKIRDLVIHSKPAPPVELDLHLKDKLLTAAVDFGLTGQGRLHLDTKAFDFGIDMNRVDLAPYLAMAGKNEFSGLLDGRAEVKGNLEQIKEISGGLQIRSLVLNHNAFRLLETSSLDVTYESGIAAVRDARLLLAGKGELKLDGSVHPDGPVDLKMSGVLPADMILLFREDLGPVTGRALVSASLDGSFLQPLVQARVELEQAGINIPELEQSVTGINGQIEMDQDKVEIKGISGKLGGGIFNLKGKVHLEKYKPGSFDAAFKGRNILLEVPDMMDISLDSTLHLKGTPDQSMLSGEIIIVDGLYYRDVHIDVAGMAKRERTRKGSVPAENPSFLENMVMDIDIRDRQPFQIDNNLAQLSIRTDLSLQGKASSPVINGRAQVDSGTVFFQKKEFEVKKGVFDFLDPYSNEPDIDVEAETEVRTWTIGLAVSGKPDNLDFKFYSDPKEEHEDIISLLTLGKTTRELRKSEGGSNFSSAQILSILMADTVQDKVREASGLDSVELELENDEETNELGGTVTFGKELSRQMNIKYGVGMKGGETVHTVTSEYKILENFLMSGFQDSGGDFGGGLKFRLEFR